MSHPSYSLSRSICLLFYAQTGQFTHCRRYGSNSRVPSRFASSIKPHQQMSSRTTFSLHVKFTLGHAHAGPPQTTLPFLAPPRRPTSVSCAQCSPRTDANMTHFCNGRRNDVIKLSPFSRTLVPGHIVLQSKRSRFVHGRNRLGKASSNS